MNKINKLLEEMNHIKTSECFYADFDEIIENYEIESISEQEFNNIFKFIEANPDIDYGGPGSLVHFLEYYYGEEYENELKKSIRRKPTCQTLLMLNRVINAMDGILKEEYLELLTKVLEMEIPDEVKECALGFYEYQKSH